jgi:rRNA maturation RNase YbeY
MAGALVIRNQQRTKSVNARYLARICRVLLGEFLKLENFDLAIYLVGSPRIIHLNEAFLRHAGPTDVITFDYSNHASRITHHARHIHGEIFLCVDEAVLQARRFRTTWQSELVRYVIHGVLHLLGHDDRRMAARRNMKRAENRLLRSMSARFALSRLACKSKLCP